jgi:hypothetical protein
MQFGYRNIEPIVYSLADQGMPLHIYCGVPDETKARFQAAGAIMHDGMSYFPLLKELSKYAWGWTGFNNDPIKKHIQYAVTNKMFEYINSGTPVLTYMTEEQDEFVKEYEIGLVVKKLKDIKRQIEDADWDKLHKNVLERRKEFTMEKQVPIIEELYEEADKFHNRHGNKYRVDPEVVEYTSFQNFPIKPNDWWVFK